MPEGQPAAVPVVDRATADAALLAVRDLHAWYGESHVLHGVELDVRAGEVVTLLGRNGAGKTTTLKSIMGIVPRRQGSIRFRDQELIARPSNAIARLGIAFCPEERGIFAALNVEENLLLPPRVADGGLGVAAIFELFPNLRERLSQPGHQALRRRAADAGHRPHFEDRRALAPPRRAHRRAGPGHRPADRPNDPPAQGRGLHHPAGGAELPLRRHRGRPPLRDGARPRRGPILERDLAASMDKLHDYLGV